MSNFLEQKFVGEQNNDNFNVCHVGTTFPDPNYVIKRNVIRSNLVVIEYITAGCGYLEINGKTYFLKKGDCYIVPHNTNHKYYSDPNNPFTKKWINVSGEIAYRLVNYYFAGITPIIVPVDILEDIEKIHALMTKYSPEASAIFSDFHLSPTNKKIDLWSDMTLKDWKYKHWNNVIKKVDHSHYGGFAFKNNDVAWQNVYTKIDGLKPHTEYTLSFSVKANQIHKLEYCSVEKGYDLIFDTNRVLLDPQCTKNYVSFSVPDTKSNEWTDVSLTFTTKETEGFDHYFNIHYGATAPSSKEALIYFHNILCKVATEVYKSIPSTETVSRVEHIRLYIEENAKENITIQSLSKKFNISATHLERIFKKTFNRSPYQYYLECKMRLAQRQLMIKELSIEQISENLNFSSRSHFEKNFLKITGETPAAYRKRKALR